MLLQIICTHVFSRCFVRGLPWLFMVELLFELAPSELFFALRPSGFVFCRLRFRTVINDCNCVFKRTHENCTCFSLFVPFLVRFSRAAPRQILRGSALQHLCCLSLGAIFPPCWVHAPSCLCFGSLPRFFLFWGGGLGATFDEHTGAYFPWVGWSSRPEG